jgi:hypothetical protein
LQRAIRACQRLLIRKAGVRSAFFLFLPGNHFRVYFLIPAFLYPAGSGGGGGTCSGHQSAMEEEVVIERDRDG